MEEKKGLFPSKETEGHLRNIMILHIQGIVLVLVLMILLMASTSILFRSALTMGIDALGSFVDMEDLNTMFDLMGFGGAMESGTSLYQVIMTALNIISYTAAFVSIAAVIIIFINMRKRIAIILEENEKSETLIRVKKAPYVWLGFLLGAFGGHYFVTKNKRAWAFLILGFVGMWIFPAILYTTAISFSDALLACYAWKDHNGYIEIEEYPYWI